MLTIDGIISKYYINSYSEESIKLSENTLTKNNQKSMLKHTLKTTFYVSFNNLVLDFSIQKFTDLDLESLQKISDIEMLLVGTGSKHTFPNKGLYGQLTKLNYSVDFMDTAAACRTFNVLANESRKVGALLFL